MVAEQTTERTTSTRLAESELNPDDYYSRLVAGPPRLASISKSTTSITSRSTMMNGIYILALPRPQTTVKLPRATARQTLLPVHQRHSKFGQQRYKPTSLWKSINYWTS
eukprot:4937479-Amphidinium_carterae.1